MTLSELQVLLALNGNERIEYAESEIFADVELYTVYLESLCSKYDWYSQYNKCNDGELAWLAYSYTIDVIKHKWPEAERVIATSPRWAYTYTRAVIKTKFPEAESIIASDRVYAEWYNDLFGTNI